MRALDVRHSFDFGDFERAQINLRDAVVSLVVDPEPMAVVPAVGLAQHWMMRVAPDRAGGGKAFVGFRTGVVRVAQAGARFEDGNLLDEPARGNSVNENAAALAAAENAVVFVELAGWNVNLLRGGSGLSGGFLLASGRIRVAAGKGERNQNK